MNTYYRHGDVILEKMELPNNLEKTDETVLAYGEVTGHAHRLTGSDFEIYREPATKRRFLRVVKDTDLTHEEHHTRTIPPGTYEIRPTKEADHIQGIIRIVAD